MPDEVDELILKMQHLEAQARAQQEANALAAKGKSLRSRAQQVAWAAQAELTAAERQQREADEKLQRARDPALKPIAAADLLEEGRRLAEDARTGAVKARAKLNFALDQMDEAERREYEALHAEARADAHRQMADDPLFRGTPAAAASVPNAVAAAPEAATSPEREASTAEQQPAADSGGEAPGPRKTLGRRRPKDK